MKPKDLIDKWGLLDKNLIPDGGDSCHREGMYYSLRGMLPRYFDELVRYKHVMAKLHVAPGVFVRHSNPDYDASDWDRMSRDQFQPMIIAAGYYDRSELKKIFRGHLKRGLLFTNNVRRNGATKTNHGKFVSGEIRNYNWKIPDPTGPEIWGNFIRSYKAWWFYPLLVMFDLELFAGAIKWRFFRKHNIALNHTLSLLQSIDRMPTPLSWLSAKVMTPEKLIVICKDHLNDRYVGMPFFGEMLDQALEALKRG